MRQIPFQTGRALCHKEGGDLKHNYFMDPYQGFFCTSEEYTLMPKRFKDQKKTDNKVSRLTLKSKKDLPVFHNMQLCECILIFN